MPELFDMSARALRRDRAVRKGPELFLHDRAFEDCLERIALMQRPFERALLIGCPDARWPERLEAFAGEVDVRDPGPLFATRANGETLVEDCWLPPEASYALVVAIGTLDTVNDLPLALRLIGHAMAAKIIRHPEATNALHFGRLPRRSRRCDRGTVTRGGIRQHGEPRDAPAQRASGIGGFLETEIHVAGECAHEVGGKGP